MARKGQSKAFLKELRRKHGLGEFSKGKKATRTTAKRKRPATRSTGSKIGIGI